MGTIFQKLWINCYTFYIFINGYLLNDTRTIFLSHPLLLLSFPFLRAELFLYTSQVLPIF